MFQSVTTTLLATAILFASGRALADVPPLKVETYVNGFDRSIVFVQDPGDPSIQYVLEQYAGLVRIIQDGQILAQPFLDLSAKVSSGSGSQGLLGIVFPPDYAATGVFFVYYTIDPVDSHLSRVHRNADNPLIADPETEEVILLLDRFTRIHNAGHMEFGPDGMLYITTGDGGSINDEFHVAQDPTQLLGKMLRLDVSGETGYTIPADNPFVDDDPIDAREEIWSFGLRNPWKFTIDNPSLGGTGAIIIGDVGDIRREEINYEPAGAGGRNYGWRNFEGTRSNDDTLLPAYGPLTFPIHEFPHVGRSAVIGGIVYRGSKLGIGYFGRYFFADINGRKLFSLGLDLDENGEATVSDVIEHTSEVGILGGMASFGADADGEMYIVTISGRIFKVLPNVSTVLTDANITSGLHRGGEPADLCVSDDVAIEVNSSFLAGVRLVVEATTTVQNPTSINVTIESRVSQPSGTIEVSVRNWQSGRFEVVASLPVGTQDISHVINGIDPLNHIAADGRIEFAFSHIVPLPFIQATFNSFFDYVDVVVE